MRLIVPSPPYRKLLTMGQSLVKNVVHLVFSSRHRQPLITKEVEDDLYSYLGGTCNELECRQVKIGG